MAVSKVGVEVILEGVANFKRSAAEVNQSILHVASSAQSSSGAFSGASGALSAFGGFLGKVFTIASGIVTAGVFMAIGRQISSMIGAAITATSEFQRLQIQFEGLIAREQVSAGMFDTVGQALGHTSEEAAELLDWIRTIAVTTPFEVEALTRTVALSMAMGFTSEKAKELTLAMGNFTAGMGLSGDVLERIIYNFGQMMMAGKVTGTELRDLARGAMFPVADVLRVMQKNLGLTNISFQKFREQAAAGKYDVAEFFEAFIDLVEQDFPDAADRMANTWQTAKSNIMDFIKVFLGVDILGPVFDDITTSLNAFLRTIMTPEAREATKSLGESLQWGFIFARDAIKEKLLPAVADLFDALGLRPPSIDDLIALPLNIGRGFRDAVTAVSGFINEIATKLPGVLAGVKTQLEPFLALWDRLKQWWVDNKEGIITAAQDMFDKMFTALKPVKDAVLELIQYGLDKLISWIEQNPDAIKNFFQSIGTFWEQTAGPALKDFGTWVSDNKDTILSFLFGLGAALVVFQAGTTIAAGITAITAALAGMAVLTGPLGLLALIIGTLAFGIAKFGSLEGLIGAAQTSAQQLAVIIQTWATEVRNQAIAAAGQFIQGLIFGFLDVPNKLMESFAYWMQLLGMEKPKWFAAAQDLVQGLIDGIKSKVSEIIATVVKMVQDAIAAAKKAGGMRSPSKLMMEVGWDFERGFGKGIVDAAKVPIRAIEGTVNHTVQAARTQLPAPAMATAGAGVSIGAVTINDPTDDMALMAMIRRNAGWT